MLLTAADPSAYSRHDFKGDAEAIATLNTMYPDAIEGLGGAFTQGFSNWVFRLKGTVAMLPGTVPIIFFVRCWREWLRTYANSVKEQRQLR